MIYERTALLEQSVSCVFQIFDDMIPIALLVAAHAIHTQTDGPGHTFSFLLCNLLLVDEIMFVCSQYSDEAESATPPIFPGSNRGHTLNHDLSHRGNGNNTQAQALVPVDATRKACQGECNGATTTPLRRLHSAEWFPLASLRRSFAVV